MCLSTALLHGLSMVMLRSSRANGYRAAAANVELIESNI